MIVERSVTISASLDAVWMALTDPQAFAKWYAFGGAQFDATPGSPLRLLWSEHGTFLGRIEESVPPKRFSYRLAVAPDIEPALDNSTLVTFTLESTVSATVLTVTESGFEHVNATYGMPDALMQQASDGWTAGFRLLRGLLEATA